MRRSISVTANLTIVLNTNFYDLRLMQTARYIFNGLEMQLLKDAGISNIIKFTSNLIVLMLRNL
jgi:hypothetical protein